MTKFILDEKATHKRHKRIYLQYNDYENNPITLAFRSQESLNKHIEQFKINKSKIKITYNRPQTYMNRTSGEIISTLSYLGLQNIYCSLAKSNVKNRFKDSEFD